MRTEVILTKHVKDLGGEGDKVAVAQGYARNYLLPQKLATLATLANVRQLDELKKRRTERETAELQIFKDAAAKIAKLALTITVQSGSGGKLFGAVTTHHIAEALAKEGIEVDHRRIELKHPIHSLGNFDVDVKLHPEVSVNLKFTIAGATLPPGEAAPAATGRSPRAKRGRAAAAEAAAPEEKPARPARAEKAEKKKK